MVDVAMDDNLWRGPVPPQDLIAPGHVVGPDEHRS